MLVRVIKRKSQMDVLDRDPEADLVLVYLAPVDSFDRERDLV